MLSLIKDGGRANYELNTCIIPIGQMGKIRPMRSHNLTVTTQLVYEARTQAVCLTWVSTQLFSNQQQKFVPISYSYTLNGKSLKGRHPPLFPHHLTHWYIVGSHYESFKNLQMIAEVDLRCITLLPYERSHYIETFILTWFIPHINLFLCNLGKKKIYIYQVTGVVFDLL